MSIFFKGLDREAHSYRYSAKCALERKLLESTVKPAKENEMRFGFLWIPGVLNDYPGFGSKVRDLAKREESLFVAFSASATYVEKDQRQNIDTGASDDFRDLPLTVKLFVRGIEAQLQTPVAYIGIEVDSDTWPAEWIIVSVPAKYEDRFHHQGADDTLAAAIKNAEQDKANGPKVPIVEE
jgi:hypothetical protein